MKTRANIQNFFRSSLRSLVPGTFENLKKNTKQVLGNYQQKEVIRGVIVSMTTYGPRLHVFEYTVLSILAGTILPEKICIYVPKGFLKLVLVNQNSIVKHAIESGYVDITEMEEDVGCHSKYFYSFREYGKTKDIIICDDDVVYYRDWLKDLYQASKMPNASVIGFKVLNVRVSSGRFAPYDVWVDGSQNLPNQNQLLYCEGVGGVYYKKNSLDDNVFQKDVFLKIAPKADDVWLFFCSHLSNLGIKKISPSRNRKLLYVIPNSQEVNLWQDNTINKRNDIYMENCREYFLKRYDFQLT